MRPGAESVYLVRPLKLKRDNKNENFRGYDLASSPGLYRDNALFALSFFIGLLIPIFVFYNYIANYEEKLLEARFGEHSWNIREDRQVAAEGRAARLKKKK